MDFNAFVMVIGITLVVSLVALFVVKKLIALVIGIAVWAIKAVFALLLLPFSLLLDAVRR